jgi:hypothetical protein
MVAGQNQRMIRVPIPGTTGRNRVTLTPLRIDGRDALNPPGVPGLIKVALVQVHFGWPNLFHETLSWSADDLFECAAFEHKMEQIIPRSGILSHAVFDFYFSESPRPRSVVLRPPDTLELTQTADLEIVERWASLHRFLFPVESRNEAHERAMAIP